MADQNDSNESAHKKRLAQGEMGVTDQCVNKPCHTVIIRGHHRWLHNCKTGNFSQRI